jgi:hypothetical protein
MHTQVDCCDNSDRSQWHRRSGIMYSDSKHFFVNSFHSACANTDTLQIVLQS